jgi:hypothetical protein
MSGLRAGWMNQHLAEVEPPRAYGAKSRGGFRSNSLEEMRAKNKRGTAALKRNQHIDRVLNECLGPVEKE